MKTFFTRFFVTLGVIFLLIIIAGGYFFVTDPYELKPLIFSTSNFSVSNADAETDASTEAGATSVANAQPRRAETAGSETETDTGVTQSAGGDFTLSNQQQQALQAIGVDPATVSTSISAEQEACFVGVLGADRVAEIKAGAVPDVFDLVRAEQCL